MSSAMRVILKKKLFLIKYEGTEENPKSGFDLYQLLDKELEKNGFLSGLLNAVAEAQAVEKNATKLPRDRKKKN